MALSNITVLTSITGEKDHLIDEQIKGNADFLAFLDNTQWSNTWRIEKAYDKFKDDRRNSRIHKILSHQYTGSEYSIWIDGNIRLLKTPEELVEKYLKDHDIAVFKHPNRDCLYDESVVCAKLNLDDPETIIEQVVMYEESGYAKNKGLCECGIILRRNTPQVQMLNDVWWSEYTRHSRRDQLSFMYAVHITGLRINAINAHFKDVKGKYIRDDAFEIVPHQHFSGNFNDPARLTQ